MRTERRPPCLDHGAGQWPAVPEDSRSERWLSVGCGERDDLEGKSHDDGRAIDGSTGQPGLGASAVALPAWSGDVSAVSRRERQVEPLVDQILLEQRRGQL